MYKRQAEKEVPAIEMSDSASSPALAAVSAESPFATSRATAAETTALLSSTRPGHAANSSESSTDLEPALQAAEVQLYTQAHSADSPTSPAAPSAADALFLLSSVRPAIAETGTPLAVKAEARAAESAQERRAIRVPGSERALKCGIVQPPSVSQMAQQGAPARGRAGGGARRELEVVRRAAA